MSTLPPISVLMPCYNAADTVDEALASLACQTLADFELVVVDDGSSDGTLERLQQWAARDERIQLLARPHAGIVEALRAGLQACRAPYIARMDADDRSRPERLALQLALIETSPELGVVGCLVQGWPEEQLQEGFRRYLSWINGLTSDVAICREIFIESPLVHPSVLLRRKWLERAGGYQERGWPEDYDLWLRLYLAGARFAKVPSVQLDWRERQERLTRTDPRYGMAQFMRAKAHYLARGPLARRDALFMRGAGKAGRLLSRELLAEGAPLTAFFDVDPRKLGSTRHGLPVLPAAELPRLWASYEHPALLVAVGTRGARPIIRQELAPLGLVEGADWWFAA